MNLTLKQMRYFSVALRTGSIASASAELNISQSSITAAIDMVEATLGAELVRRVPAKGLLPTDLGREVAARLELFLEQERVLESELLSLSGRPAGRLRMASYAPTAPHVLPPVLKRVAAAFPSIRVELIEGDMHTINRFLLDGTVDLALTYRRETNDRLPFEPLFRARPWALIPPDSPLAAQESVSPEDLVALPMILLDVAGTRSYFLGLFETRGLRPDIAHSTKDSAVLRGLVAAGFGFSILNICGANDRNGSNGFAARALRGVQDSPLFGLAYTAASAKSLMVQSVLEICRDLAGQGTWGHLVLTTRERPTG